jgi:hypothetical protein
LEQQDGLIEFCPEFCPCRIDFICDNLGQVALETGSQTIFDQMEIKGRRSERGIGVAEEPINSAFDVVTEETINSAFDVLVIERWFGRLSIGVNR